MRGPGRDIPAVHVAGPEKIMLNEKMPAVLLCKLGEPGSCTIFPCTFSSLRFPAFLRAIYRALQDARSRLRDLRLWH